MSSYQKLLTPLLVACFLLISPEVYAESGGGEEHGPGTTPLFFVIIALVIGAATRHLLKKSPIPFTVLLFIFGLGLGAFARFSPETFEIGSMHLDTTPFVSALEWAAHIDPHLLLYIFLPILIFEAAFGMDTHTFRRSISNALMLAVPGILMALALTALIAIGMREVGLGLDGWNWPIAFMFGAVVSATDPVAVVAILKDLGANKKLGTLIEGESLLNDGTAIVIFMVFLGIVTGVEAEMSPFLQFLKVAVGGALLGWAFGRFVIYWLKNVFNDALVEISIIVAASYLTFYTAEHFFHVSGVLALVVFGVMLAGSGRTRISPEVGHFLHEFWELAAFIANSLIFLIVGIVIAIRVEFTGEQIFNLFLLYVGIHVVRAIVILTLYPIMARLGYGVSKKYAIVLWWGALRGAIGLALTLIVAEESAMDPTVREEFLFLTSGVIMLTLIVNATTMKAFVKALGLTKVKPVKQLMMQEVNASVEQGVSRTVQKLRSNRYLRGVDWDVVEDYVPQVGAEATTYEIESASIISEIRRRILLKEKDSYWRQFKEGLLDPSAVTLLSQEIDRQLDSEGKVALSDRQDIEDRWKISKMAARLLDVPLLGYYFKKRFYAQLAISHGCAKGLVVAQDEALKLLSNIVISKGDSLTEEDMKMLSVLEDEINMNRIHGLTFLRNLRSNYPRVYSTLMTQQAIRSILNSETRTVERLYKRGRLTESEFGELMAGIKSKLQRLSDQAIVPEVPEYIKLLGSIKWLQEMDHKVLEQIADISSHQVYTPGKKLISQHARNESLVYIVITGSAEVWVDGKIVDVLSAGSVIGEVHMLTHVPRSADVVVQTPMSALVMKEGRLRSVIDRSPELSYYLWRLVGVRVSENTLLDKYPYRNWKLEKLQHFLDKGVVIKPEEVENLGTHHLFVLFNGYLIDDAGEKKQAPLMYDHASNLAFSEDAKVFAIPLITRYESKEV